MSMSPRNFYFVVQPDEKQYEHKDYSKTAVRHSYILYLEFSPEKMKCQEKEDENNIVLLFL